MNMGSGAAIFAPGAILATLLGTSLLGSVVPQGSLIQGVFVS